jgi:hypothetical protein
MGLNGNFFFDRSPSRSLTGIARLATLATNVAGERRFLHAAMNTRLLESF